MADLTRRLALTEGTNRVIADEANPSFVGAALDFAASALRGYSQLSSDLAEKKASAKAAEEKATKARLAFEVTGAHNAARADVMSSRAAAIPPVTAPEDLSIATPGESGIFSQLSADVSPSMERDVTRSAQQAMSVVTAVEQGRMPEISMNAALNARFSALREKYPEHTEYLLDVWKKTGLDANLFTEGKDAADEHEFMREQNQASADDARKREEGYIAAANEVLGPEAIGKSREELISFGLTATKDAYDLKQIKERLDITMKRADLSAKEREEVEESTNQSIEQKFNNAIYNQAVPVIGTIQNLMSALIRDPSSAENIQAWQEQGARLHQMIPQIAENALQTALAHGYTGDEEKFKKRITDIYGPLTDMFTGEHSVVQSSVDALRAIETSAKINTAQALPFMMALNKAGIKTAEMPAVLKALETNPELQKKLSDEINGFVDDWDEDKASTRILDIVKILRGETTLSRMDAVQARKVVGPLTATSQELAKRYVRGLDVEGEKVVHGVGNVVTAVRALTPSSGSMVLYVASKGFGSETVSDALIKAVKDPKIEDKTMAMATVQASRAASAHILNNVRLAADRANKASPYFKIGYNSRDGNYFVDDRPYRKALKSSNSGVRGVDAFDPGSRLRGMEAPDVIRHLVYAGNTSLQNAIKMGTVDPTTPKANEVQLRNWYARNTPLPSEGQKTTNPTKEVGKQLDILDDMITETFEDVLKPVKLSPEVENSEYYRQNGPAVAKAAAKYGVPEELAIGLIGKESSFNPNNPGPVIKSGTHKGDRAMGLGQVMAKTAAAYGITDRASLSVPEQADLAMRVLSDNYKQTGNWKDAVSMYFTGVPYAKAVAQGRSDGLTSVLQYVKDVM